jgi:hypothetical protein
MLQQGLDCKCEFQDFVGVDDNVLWFIEHWRPVHWEHWGGKRSEINEASAPLPTTSYVGLIFLGIPGASDCEGSGSILS